MVAKNEGPYVQAAAFCEKVLEENDGALSLIRMVDTVTHTTKRADAPEEMPNIQISTNAVISLKSGGESGDFTARMELISPSGEKIETLSNDFKLKGAGHGRNIVVNLSFEAKEEGVYFFDVFVGENLVTRMPLRIRYEKVTEPSQNS